ncbi:MAG: putative TrmH family tRNA/rRNA methyltransferase [Candidatus Hydrogenedentes bacterium ADurb.Bin170]|nr:MAG: putative TrmH family tRNA/rRNA methyltransferase [Candidatus Hydrogenedentes bacterium ADurb.Bin170]
MKKKGGQFLSGHQRSWVWGRNPVLEIIRMGTWPVRECYFSDTLSSNEYPDLSEKLQTWGIIPTYVSADRLKTLCGTTEHQGMLLRMGPFPYARWEEVHPNTVQSPLYLVLDRIQDAHNFGAIIRSAASLGASAVIVGESRQAPVNSQVVRASAGAVMHLPLVQVSDCLQQARQMKEQGISLIATALNAEKAVWECSFKRPVGLILGNEAEGVDRALLDLCDESCKIPQSSGIDSLNVAAAAAAILYESWRQKNIDTRV